MKKLLVFSMVLASFVSYGQDIPKIENGFLTVTLENGVGVEQKVKFSISDDDYNKIKSSDLFKKWKETTWSNPANAGFIEYHKKWDDVITYLEGNITSCKFTLKILKLKNGNSLEFIEGAKGMIYLSDNGGIRISFPFKAQNGYGNSIVGKTIYSIDMKNGEQKTDCYVYNN
jgi:hypothetical protein